MCGSQTAEDGNDNNDNAQSDYKTASNTLPNVNRRDICSLKINKLLLRGITLDYPMDSQKENAKANQHQSEHLQILRQVYEFEIHTP